MSDDKKLESFWKPDEIETLKLKPSDEEMLFIRETILIQMAIDMRVPYKLLGKGRT